MPSFTTSEFNTGSAPGWPVHTGHTCVLGGAPYSLLHEQNALHFVSSWTCVSIPIMASKSVCKTDPCQVHNIKKTDNEALMRALKTSRRIRLSRQERLAWRSCATAAFPSMHLQVMHAPSNNGSTAVASRNDIAISKRCHKIQQCRRVEHTRHVFFCLPLGSL
jgi:hypothetical protein